MQITHIQLHPIKALDAVRVESSFLLPSGALEFDRRWALFNSRGQIVNGKNNAAIHAIRAEYNLAALEVSLDGRTFSLRQPEVLSSWFSEHLNEAVEMRANTEAGFPDDLDSPGPTFVSAASLQLVAEWFDLDVSEVRRRFRTNLEFNGPEPFWEDQLYGFHFGVGDVKVYAVNPCQRCVVPSRDARTGAQDVGFQRRFAELRQRHLPSFAQRAGFTHFYRFAVNTRIAPPDAAKTLRVGDLVTFPWSNCCG